MLKIPSAGAHGPRAPHTMEPSVRRSYVAQVVHIRSSKHLMNECHSILLSLA